MANAAVGFKCPSCGRICYSRTSRPASSETIERYYICRDSECGFAFKTFHVLTRFICRPVPADSIVKVQVQPITRPVPEKTVSHTMRLE
ncbi:UNVERIFIED_ORG: putative RNA-binding Zn-ribbon protein involved in translation (DUF1610 family) [Buttiauxella agrestis ATCC 33320]